MQDNPAPQDGEQLDTQPGIQQDMQTQPRTESPHQTGSGKLAGKVALITGGDSGIGRAIAIAFAREGAHVSIAYLNEEADAEETKRLVEAEGRECLLNAGDVGDEAQCRTFAESTVQRFGTIDILVNNAAEQHPVADIEALTAEQLERTFRTNIFSMFYLTKAVIPHMRDGSAIINTASVTAYLGSPALLDYSATKGAIVSFTRSLSGSLIEKGIRVNAVAPGPIWTPLIPSTFPPDKVKNFGKDVPMGRPGQPDEVALAYVFLASQDASYISGQTIHVNGGEVLNG